jgi:uncharacterized membrane protein
MSTTEPSTPTSSCPRRIKWLNVSTVISAVILIAAEVFGGTFAAGWAFAILFGLGHYAHWVLQAIFFAFGMVVMAAFLRSARRIEPFTTQD